jgi:hypothetical protein
VSASGTEKHGGDTADNHGTIKTIKCRTKCAEKWISTTTAQLKMDMCAFGTGQEELKSDIITGQRPLSNH